MSFFSGSASASSTNRPQLPWFQRFARPVLFLIISVAVVGGYRALTMPVSVFPSTDFPRIVIGVDNGVMPIDQMLVTITRPIEEAVNSVPGLQTVQSITSRGSAEVDLFFDWNSDMILTLQRVDAVVARLQTELPSTAKIETHRLTFAVFPVIGYSLTSDKIPPDKLWEIANYDIKPRMNRLNGVATVIIQGGRVPEFQVTPDPARLVASGITVTDILDSVRRTNVIESPGLIESDHHLVLGLVSGQVRTAGDIGQITIKNSAAGVPIRIADIASVAPSTAPVYTVVTSNGKPAILLNVNRQPESNTLDVAAEVHDLVAELKSSLPPDVHLEAFYDQSTIVHDSIASVRDAVFLGILLSSVILVLFLRDWGTSLIAGLVIPVTLLITFIILSISGQSFNLMTLGGLAAAVGLVIDDAIVVLENIVAHRDSGQGRIESVQSALRELIIPLTGSTITPIVVFIPLIAMNGVYGTFFRALAITMSVALFTSLFLALTWTPTLSQYLVQRKESSVGAGVAPEEHSRSPFFSRIVDFYSRVMQSIVKRPVLLLVASAAVVLLSFVAYRLLEIDLLPEMDEGGFILDYWTPPGSSLAESNRILQHIEKMLHDTPEIETTSRRTGLQLGLAAVTESNRGDFTIKLAKKRSRSDDEIISDLRAQINTEEPSTKVEFPKLLSDMVGDLTSQPEPVVIKLFSPDGKLLNETAPKVAEAIGKVHGVVDVLDGVEDAISGPVVTYQVNPIIAARAGFTPEEVSTDALAVLEGAPAATPVVQNDRAYTIRIRFPDANRSSLDRMTNTLLVSSTGKTATLGALASMVQTPGETEIRRENLQRLVTVTARLEGVDLGGGMREVQKAVDALHLPASIRIEYGGQYQEQQRSFRELLKVLFLALLLLFAVLLFEFRTFAAPTAILASAVLSTFGGFVALLITRTTFNVASFMGMIMVIGVVAKNGILLLDADAHFRDAGMSAEDAMLHAGRRRLRPITMTALATVAGMLPLALGIGAGAQMLQPLAISVIGGLLSSMIFSLVFTPVIHFEMQHRAGPESA
ncbi:MAG TPA: efflux RND transporter permease subunit [Candidatus Acidoferrum sp.]|nr:efflux RND transporter permease subunit [Candidatus Acidoferrum sp.]